MANYLSDRTGAQIDTAMDAADAALPKAGGTLTGDVTSSTGKSLNTVLDNADAGNVGKVNGTDFSGDVNSILISGFTRVSGTATNIPLAESGGLLTTSLTSTNTTQVFHARTNKIYVRGQNNSTFSAWQELYHTGNTGVLGFSNSGLAADVSGVNIGTTAGIVAIGNDGTALSNVVYFTNANGNIGAITTTGTATSYNTSSDPRLKDFKDAPSDKAINDKFDDLFSTFKTFNWKNDSDGKLVWGFDAHACIDAKLDLGSEGQGPRDLKLGDVYETTPAVFDKDGVEITAAIEKKVSPAGVDQSKAVPILLAKIEQLERRLTAAGL